MAQQYVRFMRGNTQAFNLLTTKDKDTLYFIYDNDTEGMLYLGDRLIAGGDIGSTSIDELKDVLISAGITDGSILVYEQGQWVNKPLDEVVPVFVGPSSGSTGVPGLVPAPPQDSPDLFLRSDGTWAVIEVGDKLVINENVFVQDDDGTLDLLGFDKAEAGAQLQKGANGQLSWVVPDTETVAGLSSAVAGLRTDLNTLSQNTYDKTETDTKIAEAVANSAHLKRKIVANLTEASDYVNTHADSVEYIFMVPATLNGIAVDDRYDEYMAIPNDDGTRTLEKVGSWEVDLKDYAKTEDVQSQLGNKVDKAEGERLITDDEAAKLESMLRIEKVDGTLSFDTTTNTLKVKEISSSQITDLSTWIQTNAGKVTGLSEQNFSTALAEKLAGIATGAEKNYIRSVVAEELEVSNEGQLGIKAIASSKVTGLSELLRNKADAETVAALRTDVNTLAAHLTWGELT